MSRQQPVEYADGGRGPGEAVRSLAEWLGTSEVRALELLRDGTVGPEIRSRNLASMTTAQAMRETERRYLAP